MTKHKSVRLKPTVVGVVKSIGIEESKYHKGGVYTVTLAASDGEIKLKSRRYKEAIDYLSMALEREVKAGDPVAITNYGQMQVPDGKGGSHTANNFHAFLLPSKDLEKISNLEKGRWRSLSEDSIKLIKQANLPYEAVINGPTIEVETKPVTELAEEISPSYDEYLSHIGQTTPTYAKNKNIDYGTSDEFLVDGPGKSLGEVPDWFKEIPYDTNDFDGQEQDFGQTGGNGQAQDPTAGLDDDIPFNPTKESDQDFNGSRQDEFNPEAPDAQEPIRVVSDTPETVDKADHVAATVQLPEGWPNQDKSQETSPHDPKKYEDLIDPKENPEIAELRKKVQMLSNNQRFAYQYNRPPPSFGDFVVDVTGKSIKAGSAWFLKTVAKPTWHYVKEHSGPALKKLVEAGLDTKDMLQVGAALLLTSELKALTSTTNAMKATGVFANTLSFSGRQKQDISDYKAQYQDADLPSFAGDLNPTKKPTGVEGQVLDVIFQDKRKKLDDSRKEKEGKYQPLYSKISEDLTRSANKKDKEENPTIDLYTAAKTKKDTKDALLDEQDKGKLSAKLSETYSKLTYSAKSVFVNFLSRFLPSRDNERQGPSI